MTRHIRIDLGYCGARFLGSQRQPGVRTVQGELESAVERVTGERVTLTFAGRTDRGVHAVGQVASGNVVWSKSEEKLRFALDSLTGRDLAVYRVTNAVDEFNARFSAHRREYRYRVWNSPRRPVLGAGWTHWFATPLDLVRLNEAAAMITGEHDFRSFAGKGFGSGESTRNTRRTIFEAGWRLTDEAPEPHGRVVEFRIVADSYLPHMVRNIVGVMLDIGCGEFEPNLMQDLISRRDRKAAPAPAPPEGLVLWNVEY